MAQLKLINLYLRPFAKQIKSDFNSAQDKAIKHGEYKHIILYKYDDFSALNPADKYYPAIVTATARKIVRQRQQQGLLLPTTSETKSAIYKLKDNYCQFLMQLLLKQIHGYVDDYGNVAFDLLLK